MSDSNMELMIRLLEAHKDRLDSIDHNLALHMKRTEQNEEMVKKLTDLHTDNQKRIENLEEPRKARKYLKEALFEIGKVAGVILTLATFLKLFGKV